MFTLHKMYKERCSYTVPKIWQISVGNEEEVLCRENFPVIQGN
jgi:hypothetical protein